MQITHEEAYNLIQLKADNILGSNKQEVLEQHLRNCVKCTAYADGIHDMTDVLRSTMQKHWNHTAPPLQLGVTKTKISFLHNARSLLTTRSAIVGAVMLLIGFAMWQFTLSGTGPSNPMILGASPIPTPSFQLTSTQQQTENCDRVQYQIRPDDTLESIALQFSTSKETIISINDLRSESIRGRTELSVPVCTLTPTGTIHPPTFTTTPYTEAITYTPG